MDILVELLNLTDKVLNWASVHFPDGVALLIGALASPILAICAKISKKWDSLTDLQKNAVAVTVAVLAVTVNYLLKNPTVAPELAIPASAFILTLINKPYYKLIIQPIGSLFARGLAKQMDKVRAYNDELKAATAPQPAAHEDFSN